MALAGWLRRGAVRGRAAAPLLGGGWEMAARVTATRQLHYPQQLTPQDAVYRVPVVPQRVAVLGAGLSGLTTALALQLEGHLVTLFDDGSPGEVTHRGADVLFADFAVEPVGLSGAWKAWSPLGSLFGKVADVPLAVPLNLVTTMMPWLETLRRNASDEGRRRAITAARRAILEHTVPAWDALLSAADAAQLKRHDGHLALFPSEAGWRDFQPTLEARAAAGAEWRECSQEEVAALAPAARSAGGGGVHAAVRFTTGAHLAASPPELRQSLFAAFKRKGGRFIQERASGLGEGQILQWHTPAAGDWRRPLETSQHVPHSPQQDKFPSQAVLTASGRELQFNWVVVAAGAHSAPFLSQQLAVEVPVVVERVCATYNPDAAASALSTAVVLPEAALQVAPLADGAMHTAGQGEVMEGAPSSPFASAAAAAALQRVAAAALPALLPGPPPSTVTAEDRTLLPDSLPVIGPALRTRPNVLCNFGHGHWALSMAAPAAALVTDLVARRPPRADLEPCRVDRDYWAAS